MSPPIYTRATERFQCNGIDLNSPVDATRPGFYPIVENVRSYTEGVIQPRQGLSVIATVSSTNKTPIHSIRRLNDPANSSWARIVGDGDSLAYGQASFTRATYTAADLVYDGNPLILTPFRPDQATTPFMYISAQVGNDSGNGYLRQMKISRTGTVHQWGVPAPIYPPKAELGSFTNYAANGVTGATIGYNFQSTTNWTGAGNRDGTVITGDPALAVPNRVAAVAVTAAVYDSGATGWCSVVLPAATLSTIGVGSQLDFTNGPTSVLIVHEVYPGTVATATIRVASVIYDSDAAPVNSTIATIQPDKAVPEIKRNCVVQINAAQYYRVISTRTAADGTTSFRVQGNGANTIAAAQSIVVVPSIRVCDTTGLGLGATTVAQANLTVTLQNVSATGWFQNVTNTADLTVSNTGAGSGRALSDDDYIHISLKCSDWSRITQGRILLNCDVEAAATFTRNYYYRTFTANDLQPAAQGTPTQTAIDNRTNNIIRGIVDNPSVGSANRFREDNPRFDRTDSRDDKPDRRKNTPTPGDPNTPAPSDPSRSQAVTGANQWSELRFRIGELKLTRVGSDASRGLANINGMRLEITVTAGAAATFEVNSFNAWGTYPLDCGELGEPYIYRTRGRSSATGARSNYSPPSLGGVMALRESITVTPIQASTTNRYGRAGKPTEVDYYDIERLGGVLTNWTYVGTVPAGTAFTDIIADDVAVANASFSEGDTNYQPWLIKAAPTSGLFSTVAGTMGTSTTTLNLDYAKGTAIRVQRSDGTFTDTTIRRIIDTGTGNGVNVEFADSIGSSTANVIWTIAEPLITSSPLPAFWVWNDQGFSCGDVNNPGVLYYTNGSNIDGTQDTSWLEITSPSEPLTSGCSFNGKNYVWSSERMFEIEQLGQDLFLPIEIPGRKGLASIYGLCAGERLWWVARDGIYQSAGGDAISITDEALKPLFVTEGNAGQTINGFNAPDFTAPNKIRLSYYDGYLYFIYQDTSGNLRCLAYYTRSAKPGWWPDTYLDGRGVSVLYGEEGHAYTAAKPTSTVHSLLAGGNDVTTAKLYQVTGSADNTSAIATHVRTRSFDAQDRRANKYWGDFVVDADSQGSTLNLVVGTNNHAATATTTPTIASTSTAGRIQTVIDIGSSGTITKARNIDLDIQWSSTGTPKLYLWEPSYITLPEASNLRPTYWDDLGHEGDKFVQGIEIETDTTNVARTVLVEYDGGTLADTLTVQHNGNQTKTYAFHPAFIAQLVRLRPTDSGSWENFKYKWIYQLEAPSADRWESQQTSLGADQFLHMKEAYICLRSTMSVVFSVTRTDDSTTTSYIIPTTAGSRMKVRVPFAAAASKGKAFSFVLTSTSAGGAFRLYKEDTSILVKPWGSEQSFVSHPVNTIGGSHGGGIAPV